MEKLSEPIPVCMWHAPSKLIRLPDGTWVAASPLPGVKLTHGICPHCMEIEKAKALNHFLTYMEENV